MGARIGICFMREFMKMFTAGGEETRGKSTGTGTPRAAVVVSSSVPSSQVTQPPPHPREPAYVAARYYRIILGYFTRASDFGRPTRTNGFTRDRYTAAEGQRKRRDFPGDFKPQTSNRARNVHLEAGSRIAHDDTPCSGQGTWNVHKRSIQA